MYQIKITKQAKKELKHISKLYRQAVLEAIEEIKENPSLGKPLTQELTGKFSYRIDVYRIIYKVYKQDGIIKILSAGHRESIYKK